MSDIAIFMFGCGVFGLTITVTLIYAISPPDPNRMPGEEPRPTTAGRKAGSGI